LLLNEHNIFRAPPISTINNPTGRLALLSLADGFIVIHETLCTATESLDKDLLSVARESGLCRRLMTIPGVGPIVALSFIALVDDASRFRKASDIGAFLGLTPRRHQSGEVD
jgi:transposase